MSSGASCNKRLEWKDFQKNGAHGYNHLYQKGVWGVKVNDDIGKNFQTKKGLRQGDPLSPLLINLVVDMLESFQENSFIVKTREQKSIDESLAVSASLFIIPIHSTEKYEVEVCCRLDIPDNIIH